MFNINDLVVFLEAAKCNNFSEAGRHLNLSQPAISQKINNLEAHFNTKLFDRKGRYVRITESGQILRSMSKELVGAAKRLEETMLSLDSNVIGEMTIGCSTASGKYLLPGLIAAFRKDFPEVRINVLVGSRRSVINRLLTEDYSFAISSKKIENRDLEYKPLFKDKIILIVPATHPWVKVHSIRPEDLLDQPLIMREESAGTREVLMDGLKAHNISPDMLNIIMELGNAESIEMAVEEGIGISFISHLAAMRGLALGTVIKVSIDQMPLERIIYIARNTRIPLSRAQAEFWSFLDSGEILKQLSAKARGENNFLRKTQG
ncbi:MAG TPA: LysR family transcriptional regulator [Anaerolineae bacterium]|nr:LysR family transcriptional regulator [Anaerolineae bacterium]